MLVVLEREVGCQHRGDAVFVGGVVVDGEGRGETLQRHEVDAVQGAFFGDGEGAEIRIRVMLVADGQAVKVHLVRQLARLAAGGHAEEYRRYDDDARREDIAGD